MTDTIEVYVDLDGRTHLVGLCHYNVKRGSQSSVFEYNEEWLEAKHAFAIDPENLPLRAGPYPKRSSKSALPGALRDTAPDRWGRQLIRRAFRKVGEQRTLSEVDYLLAINDATRIGALRYKRQEIGRAHV